MSDHSVFAGTRAGTVGGTLLVLLNIDLANIIQTSVLAAIGAIVSFAVSLLMKKLFRRRKDRK